MIILTLNCGSSSAKFQVYSWEEHEAGIYTADVLQLKEQTGSIKREYIDNGLLYNYHPADIFGNIIDPEFLCVTPFTIELDWWSYNTDLYSDLPISSWWDVTKPEWNGKFIFLDSPV